MRLKVSNQLLEPGVLWVQDIDQDVDWTVAYDRLFFTYHGFSEKAKDTAKFKLENKIDIILDTDSHAVYIPKVTQRNPVMSEINQVLATKERPTKEDNPIEYVNIVNGVANTMIHDGLEYQKFDQLGVH